MEIADILGTPAVWFVGALLVSRQARHLPRRTVTWIYVGYCGHLMAGVAQVLLTRNYFGGGDMNLYAREGEWIADAVWQNPAQVFPEVVRLALQQTSRLPVPIVGEGSSTGSMAAFSGLLFLVTGGSLHATIAIIAAGAYLGKLALYKALRERMPECERGLLVACLLLPSAMFWSSGLLKESIAVGPLCLLVALLLRARGWWSWRTLAAILWAVPVALTKSYILFVLVLAAAAMFYVTRARRRGRIVIRPLYFMFGGAAGITAIVLLGRLFPEYAVDSIADNLAHQQTVGQRVTGGSTYSIATGEERTILGQLAFAPVSIITSLFRPFFFEFHNAASFIAAAEATVVTGLAVRATAKRGWREMSGQVLNSPVLAFCAVFALAFGLGVGLGTTNMGTLSRYRMPLMPFWATLLVVWNADLFDRKARHATARTPRGARPRIRPRADADA